MSFVRVRHVGGSPPQEFDVPPSRVERFPDRYEVIDKNPVAKQRPASSISGVIAPTPAMVRVSSPGEDTKAPSEGPPKEET